MESGVSRLEAEVKASGVHATERVAIRVFPSDQDAYDPTPIYRSDGGADADGNFDTKLSIPLPLNGKRYILIQAWVVGTSPSRCDKDLNPVASGAVSPSPSPAVQPLGCLFLKLPSPDDRPQLTVSTDGEPKLGVLGIKVSETGVAAGQSISLEVSGKSRGVRKAIYRAFVRENGSGSISDEVRVAVPAGFTDVCVAAKLGPAWQDVFCPPDADQETAWALLGTSVFTK